MRRSVSSFLVAVVLVLPAGPASAGQESQKLLLDGDMALWTVAIKADKTAQFEEVLGRLRDALQSSEKPERREQGRRWRVLRMSTPLHDGNVGYIHVVSQPVRDADYTVMRILYETFPDEARALYEKYMDCFAANVSLASGTLVMDMAATK